jgi:hypothetical protein
MRFEAPELSGEIATMRTTPPVCSGKTSVVTLKLPWLTDAGTELSLKSKERTIGNGIGVSAATGSDMIPTLPATKSAAKSARRMRITITGTNLYIADNVRYVKSKRN